MGNLAATTGQAGECKAVLTRLLDAFFPEPSPALADRLILEFGSLSATLAASPERLARICGADLSRRLGAVRAALLHSARADLEARPLLGGTQAVLDYLRLNLTGLRAEHCMVLFLDARNHLLREEVLFKGALTGVGFSNREIVARALELGASSLIVAHNHPSGNPEPSTDDIATTRRLMDGLRQFDVALLDHLVIAGAVVTSFRARGLL